MANRMFWVLIIGIFVGVLVADKVSAAQTPVTTIADQETVKDPKINYSKSGYELMKETTIGFLTIALSDSEVLNGLGEPEGKSAEQVWGADGRPHQKWLYPAKGIELGMIRKDGKQVVERMSIKSPCEYKTNRGIGIGSTANEVQTAYKAEINSQDSKADSRLVAGTIYGGIIFGMKDGIVSAIFIGAAAE
jgi:hypothetical protein